MNEQFKKYFNDNCATTDRDSIQSLVILVRLLCNEIDKINKNSEQNKIDVNLFATKEYAMTLQKQNHDLKVQTENQVMTTVSGIRNEISEFFMSQQKFRHEVDDKISDLLANMESRLKFQSEQVKIPIFQFEQQLTKVKDDFYSFAKEKNIIKQDVIEIRKNMPRPTEALLNTMISRLEKLEMSTLQSLQDSKNDMKNITLQQNDERMSIQSLRDELHETLLKVQAKYDSMPNTFSRPNDQPVIINGEIQDISPLMRGIYRDSKRLDCMDQTIANIRQENDDIVNSIVAIQKNQQVFNHNIHDIGLGIQKQRAEFVERFRFFNKSYHFLESQISEIWNFFGNVMDSINHITSNVNKMSDQIENILMKLTRTPLPSIGDLGDVQLEANALKENISDKITFFEGEKEALKAYKIPEQEFVSVQPVEVEILKRRYAPLYDESTENSNRRNLYDEGIIKKSLEEIRIRQNEIQHIVNQLSDKVNDTQKQMETTFKEKVDSSTFERYFLSLQESMNKIERKHSQNETRNQQMEQFKTIQKRQYNSLTSNDLSESLTQSPSPRKFSQSVLQTPRNKSISINTRVVSHSKAKTPDENIKAAGISARASMISKLVSGQNSFSQYD